MAAIASTAVSAYPTDGSGEYSPEARRPGTRISRQLKITGVTAADTATAAVLGFSKLFSAGSAVYGATPTPCPVGIDLVNNLLIVGAGASNETVYLTVVGAPAITTQ